MSTFLKLKLTSMKKINQFKAILGSYNITQSTLKKRIILEFGPEFLLIYQDKEDYRTTNKVYKLNKSFFNGYSFEHESAEPIVMEWYDCYNFKDTLNTFSQDG